MFTNKDISIALNIIDTLRLPDKFGTEEEYFDNYSIKTQLHNTIITNYGGYYVCNGISKVVIVSDELPFVIKIPFNGEWIEEEEGNGEYTSTFYEFCMSCAEDESDYCAAELAAIEAATAFGFGAIFAKEMFLCELNGHKFYLQEKVSASNCSKHYMPSDRSQKRAREIDREYKICTEMWRACVIELYGEQFLNDFVMWADKERPEILADLHGGNYGYNSEGRPVLFDVSGFYD